MNNTIPAPHYPGGDVRELLQTDFVTPKTREVMLKRLEPSAKHEPTAFDAPTYAILEAVCARLIPQTERKQPVDLAGMLDRRLTDDKGNGWRYDALPPDKEAYITGLHGLDNSGKALFSRSFTSLSEQQQDELLQQAQDGVIKGAEWESLPAKRFFEELLADLVEFYYSDPVSMQEIGYIGMADARGWQALGLNKRESWEAAP